MAVKVSRRSTRHSRARTASERDAIKMPSAGIDRLLQVSAVLQNELPLEQQIQHVLEAARDDVGLDRLHVWAASPQGDHLIHAGGSGVSAEDRHSLGERMTIPLAKAGAMAEVYRGKLPVVVNEAHPLTPRSGLKQPYSNIKALRTNSFVAVPIIARGCTFGPARGRQQVPPNAVACRPIASASGLRIAHRDGARC
jgi:hypothetical protein